MAAVLSWHHRIKSSTMNRILAVSRRAADFTCYIASVLQSSADIPDVNGDLPFFDQGLRSHSTLSDTCSGLSVSFVNSRMRRWRRSRRCASQSFKTKMCWRRLLKRARECQGQDPTSHDFGASIRHPRTSRKKAQHLGIKRSIAANSPCTPRVVYNESHHVPSLGPGFAPHGRHKNVFPHISSLSLVPLSHRRWHIGVCSGRTVAPSFSSSSTPLRGTPYGRWADVYPFGVKARYLGSLWSRVVERQGGRVFMEGS